MRFSSKQSVFSVQALVLLSALVAMDVGSAVQMQPFQAVMGITVAPVVEVISTPARNAAKNHNPRCAVWASCNGKRQAVQQAVQFNHKRALLLAMAGLKQGL